LSPFFGLSISDPLPASACVFRPHRDAVPLRKIPPLYWFCQTLWLPFPPFQETGLVFVTRLFPFVLPNPYFVIQFVRRSFCFLRLWQVPQGLFGSCGFLLLRGWELFPENPGPSWWATRSTPHFFRKPCSNIFFFPTAALSTFFFLVAGASPPLNNLFLLRKRVFSVAAAVDFAFRFSSTSLRFFLFSLGVLGTSFLFGFLPFPRG